MISKTFAFNFFILFSLSGKLNAQNSVKPDNRIGKKELEIAFITGFSDRGALVGSQLIYRFPIGCKFKLGGGFHFSVDENKGGSHPAIFADLSKFVGNKQKWKFSGQVGRGFYETSYQYNGVNGSSYYTKESKEIFYHLSAVYRMSISNKVCFFVGPYYLLQTYEAFTEIKDGLGQTLNPVKARTQDGGGGLRFGFVF